jgi:ferrous iron transport protein B
VALTKLLRVTVFRGESTPFIMELPPYRVPTFQGLGIHAWERCEGYLRKAGTVILAISIVLWWATSYPALRTVDTTPPGNSPVYTQPAEQMSPSVAEQRLTNSYIARLARGIEPAMKPMGFDWKIGTALMGAVAAKEVFVAQLGIVYSESGGSSPGMLRETLQKHYTPLVGFCIMLFTLIALPCVATVAATKSETGSWLWALAQWGGLTLIGWAITTIVYQAGLGLGIGS